MVTDPIHPEAFDGGEESFAIGKASPTMGPYSQSTRFSHRHIEKKIYQENINCYNFLA